MAGVNKEIWISQLMEKFYAESTFLDYAQDMTEFVEYNTINLADAGIDPDVIWNNTVFPIPIQPREDDPLVIPLDTAITKPTHLTSVEKMEAAYNKMESVIRGHRRTLRSQCLERAAHAYAPASHAAFTPVIEASGAVRADTARKKLTWDDIARLKESFDLTDVEGRLILVLHPYHVTDLKNQDRTFFKEFSNIKTGEVYDREGFIMSKYSKNPVFDGTNVKKAFGAVAAPATDRYSSFAFVADEVMKCDGSYKMYSELDKPQYAGDLVNFEKRFKAMPIRNKYIGAIVSGT